MAPPTPGMKLTFSDEFNSLNLYSTWKPTDLKGNRNLPANGEEQIYVDPKYKGLGLNPFSVSDGVLNIKAAKAGDNADKLDGSKYTSGMLSSFGQGGFSQQYGYFEIRAQLPEGQGMWPAFWLLDDNGDWPPELDVMESVGSSPNSAVQSIHSGDGNNGETTHTAENLQKGFHTYGMNWTKDTITYYIDGKETTQVATPSDMHDKMYMLMNLAVGGNWPGSPDETTDWSKTNYKIDYVRVYSNDPNATPVADSSLAGAQTASSAAAQIASSVVDQTASSDDNGGVVFSNAMPGSDAAASFRAGTTSQTYSAEDMAIDGVTSPTTATVSYNDDNDVTVTNDGEWSAIRNASVKSDAVGNVTLHNFVDAEIAPGDDKARSVTVSDAKRGDITTGAGNDTIDVTGQSDTDTLNLMTIDAGDGNNQVSYAGQDENQVQIDTGTGDDAISVSGASPATISGGTGRDVYSFMANAHATITDFNPANDSIELKGVNSSDVQVHANDNSTFIELGNSGRITVAGAALTANGLHLSYA